ncbi:tagatose 1,6-diphosphate aldolase [Rhodobacteraceae bacterium N5(2021)]|uniref:Tagatose 1,6-diphosphate aldolase n=1 Tax=Gymnodinialimonas phycosphaerae TaxID=2841589 RepID=A0A975TRQ0_9RHOB|nr:tagatose 1,6-diphosphate aldolase [Gymnodinialimonas phycosphaerae]MBY4893568.1 tagatose 1,6-diphosphate aldolase [Gymnodinialimonas phycosphaerae]
MQSGFHGVAVDAGSGLAASLRDARGKDAADSDLLTFKRAVLDMLGPDASTVLLDATCGPALLPRYPEGCARMIALEADVYHISDADRITVLPDNLTVEDFPGMGVNLLKFFMYYAPDDSPELNARKHDLVADVGARCRAEGVRFLMEPLVYHPTIAPGTEAYAQIKPDLVRRATEVFAHERFQAEVLKVEIPVDLDFVEGFGAPVMTRSEALEAFRTAASAAGGINLVYLSAGVTFERFEASLKMAREAGCTFAGFMCGRAIWSDAVDIFGSGGEGALRAWLGDTGRARLKRLIAALD